MRLLVAFVIAVAAVGCGGSSSPDAIGPDMASILPADCHSTISEGEACDPACHYLGDFCGCPASHVWTCHRPDMTMTD
ncbi:MAG: hypothetical protein ACXVDD_19535 [Polyangia bacterium]